MQHLALIGFGAISRSLVATLCDQPDAGLRALSLLVRSAPDKAHDAATQLCAPHGIAVKVYTDLADLLAAQPDVVVECAGQPAVAAHGEAVLRAGIDLITASVGAFADQALFDRLKATASGTGAQIILPAGAIGGIDALVAARLSGLEVVTYTGRKPPSGWAGTDAENRVDLAALTEPTVFFEGSAREAATTFPKNANVAATLALAGLGMDATRVRLIADPHTRENTHEYLVKSQAVDFSLSLTGKVSPLNPKTSLSTAYSLARVVLNRSGAIVI
ncbi:aspartate dehydrogenase [Pararhodobacter oceanensis]|uniref:L-aspartate dehydrogenase n=1 Tax=Pararhodobacter oceanensis TaxID=2172121 RepID=A0A2T8HUZ7_9RHOB|nr:aspartate dehydrogenase [Pararhodobacter oceanensis]PVH29269.1 aspartate dehydrogenase [Pararhodobacter oceanensis]